MSKLSPSVKEGDNLRDFSILKIPLVFLELTNDIFDVFFFNKLKVLCPE